jgi:hypothetical protein
MNSGILDAWPQDVACRTAASAPSTGLITGQVVGITSAGRALVDYPGNPCGPLEARSVVALPMDSLEAFDTLPVVLFFDRHDSCPVIMGIIREAVRDAVQPVESAPSAGLVLAGPGREVAVDGKTMQLEAAQEIVLRCGKSSLTLRRDGKIVLRGTEIVSRASEANKIKGSTVKIN